jgi:hypothetical protein
MYANVLCEDLGNLSSLVFYECAYIYIYIYIKSVLLN